MMFGVDEVWKEYGAKNLPIELHAATTEGSSMHIGIIYFLLFITICGIIPKGRLTLPITFSTIVSAKSKLKPPV